MIPKIEISSEILSTIYSAASSKLMTLDEILISVKDKKFKCYQKNADSSGMFIFESEELEYLADLTFDIPIYVKDIKTILSIVKKDKAELEIQTGENIFKYGKLTKKFPQPAEIKVPNKVPSFNVTTVIDASSKTMETLVSSFSDIKEGDIKISAETDIVQFTAHGDVRSTDICLDSADVINYSNNETSESGYDKEMLISMFNTTKDGGVYKIEMGNSAPLRYTQVVPKIGSLILFVAPKIYD